MNVLIQTQYLENYGSHDGELDKNNEVPQWWKFKGGAEYLVINVDKEANAVACVVQHLFQSAPRKADMYMEIPRNWKSVLYDRPDAGEYEEWEDMPAVIDYRTGDMTQPRRDENVS